MNLRKFLDNPNGGQLFSALVVLSLAVVGLGICIYAGINLALEGRLNELKFVDLEFAVICGVVAAAAVNFLRLRHGAR